MRSDATTCAPDKAGCAVRLRVRFSALTSVRARPGSLFTSWFEIDAATDLRPCFGINLFMEEAHIGKGYRAIGKAQSLVGFPLLKRIAGQGVFGTAKPLFARKLLQL
jgi:hypothetical protein